MHEISTKTGLRFLTTCKPTLATNEKNTQSITTKTKKLFNASVNPHCTCTTVYNRSVLYIIFCIHTTYCYFITFKKQLNFLLRKSGSTHSRSNHYRYHSISSVVQEISQHNNLIYYKGQKNVPSKSGKASRTSDSFFFLKENMSINLIT